MPVYANDNELITAFRKGEPAAENFIFRKFFRPMCLIADKLTGQLPVAEDIVAEAFIKLFERRTEFERPDNISAFLYVTVRNAAITYNTTRKRHQTVHRQIAATTEQTQEQIPEALQLEILEAELVHAIYMEMEHLPGRAGVPDLSGLTQSQFRQAIMDERKWELGFEFQRR